MTVKELKTLIADLPDDMIMVVDAPDHSYMKVRASEITIMMARDGHMYEHYNNGYKDREDGEVTKVLWFG